MPVSSLVSTTPTGLVARPRFIKSRTIEKAPPKHGEKPFEQLVEDAFNGQPTLTLSRRYKLLEEADDRKIRRGDAIDLIESVRRKYQKHYRVTPRSRAKTFALQFAAFAAFYTVIAVAWCLIAGGH